MEEMVSTKRLIGFLLQPEDSSGYSQPENGCYVFAGGAFSKNRLKGHLKALLWILLSVLLSLVVAGLN